MIRPLAVLLLAAAAQLPSAQKPIDTDYTVNVDVELVHLPVSVVDKDGYPFLALQQQHFNIYEDRVLQDITLFKQEDIPVTVGLVLDSSGSMRYEMASLRAAASTFVRESNSEDETFIVSFGDQPRLDQDFTRTARDLNASLDRIAAHGSTSLYDAVSFAANHIQKGFHEKKALLVVSDGVDNRSRYKSEEVLDELRESRIILYTIGLARQDGPLGDAFLFKTKGKKILEQFAKVTGGRAFFPGSMKEIDEICRMIARDLRSQYTLGYRPSNTKLDGSWRKVTVQVRPPGGSPKLRVHTKQGYFAPSVAEQAGRK
jgi:Ca-activated chloride channel homolog